MQKKGKTRDERTPSLANRKSIDPRILKELAKKAADLGGYDAISSEVENLWGGEFSPDLSSNRINAQESRRRNSGTPAPKDSTSKAIEPPKPLKKEKEKQAEKKLDISEKKIEKQRFRPPKQSGPKAEKWKELRRYDSNTLDTTQQLSKICIATVDYQRNWLLPKLKFPIEDFRKIYSLSSKLKSFFLKKTNLKVLHSLGLFVVLDYLELLLLEKGELEKVY